MKPPDQNIPTNKIQSLFDAGEVSWKDVVKNLIFLAVIIGAIYVFTTRIGLENLRDKVAEAGAFAPLLIILLKATTIVVVPLGGTPLYPIAGALFGFWKGLFITLLGDALGSAIAFMLSRRFGKKILRYFMPKQHLPTIDKLVEQISQPKTFLKARLFFTGFPELFAYASGLTNVSFFTFLIVHVGIHAVPAGLLVIFGDLIVSGNILAVSISFAVSTLLAFAGIWWFHGSLTQGA